MTTKRKTKRDERPSSSGGATGGDERKLARDASAVSAGANDVAMQTVPGSPVDPGLPSGSWRTAISVLVVGHLFFVAISFFAVVEPSGLHAKLLDLAHPYLQITHVGADDRPVYLAYGDTTDQPHRIEWSKAESPGEADWETLDPKVTAGLASSDRWGRFLLTVTTLAENDQSSLVADLLLPIVRQQPNMTHIRVVRLPTLLTTVVDDAAPPPYVARVVASGRSSDLAGSLRLVRIQEPRLVTARAPQTSPSKSNSSAAPVPAPAPAPAGSQP